MGGSGPERLTFFQRMALRQLEKEAGRRHGEPLEPEDWAAVWRVHETGGGRVLQKLMLALPRSPRCSVCGAPFEGIGGALARPLGYRPSRKNPTICARVATRARRRCCCAASTAARRRCCSRRL